MVADRRPDLMLLDRIVNGAPALTYARQLRGEHLIEQWVYATGHPRLRRVVAVKWVRQRLTANRG